MNTPFDLKRPVPARVLVVDADDALSALLGEWLAGAGHRVVTEDAAEGSPDLVIVDLPFPRQCGLDRLRRIAADHPGLPVLALSSAFFAGIGSSGAVARALGVAAVLPKPVAREALLAAVGDLLVSPR